jgi:protein-disulfide isomerase/uncharacterized membrane protein
MEAQNSILQEEKDSSRSWHVFALITAVVGLLISLYSIYHYRLLASSMGHTEAFCNINETFNCDAVASSMYSRFLTIPWSVWGAAYFFTVLGLLFCSFKRLGNRKEHLFAYTVCVLTGGIVAVALAFISFRLLHVGCLICMCTYAVNAIQLGIVWFGFKRKHIDLKGLTFKNIYSSLVSTVLGLAVVLITYNIVGEQDPMKKNTSTTPVAENESSSRQETAPVHIPLSLNAYSGLGEDYRKGPDDAKIRIDIFSDFQCPSCKGVSELLEELYQSYPSKILMVYHNFPLDQGCNPLVQHKMHVFACPLASLARCAGRFGKFWQYHDLAFSKQSELKEQSAVQWAKEIGLSDEQVNACLSDKSIADKIQEDVKLGIKLGIEGTPSLYLNGRHINTSFQEFKNEVKRLAE